MLGAMGERGIQEEVGGWEGGKPGRPPSLLAPLALEELFDEALLRGLGLRRGGVLFQGLLLLRLALEAHKNGAELRWNTAEDLKDSLLDFLNKGENAHRLLAALGSGEKALLGVSKGPSPEKALRRAVEALHVHYHPRDLVLRLLKRLDSRLRPPDSLLPLLKACNPEAWAAATPLVGAFLGVFALLARSYGLPALIFEQALAPCFVFAFLRGAGNVGRPFREVPPLTLDKKALGLRYPEECWVARIQPGKDGPGELYERCSCLSEKDCDPSIPSPSLEKALPGWYRALGAWAQGVCGEGCFPHEGYDWDLVAEYRHALWEALASSGKGGAA